MISDKKLRKICCHEYTSKEIGERQFVDAKRAIEIVVSNQDARTTFLMKQMHIGYSYAAKLMDILAEVGVVRYYRGQNKRDVLLRK